VKILTGSNSAKVTHVPTIGRNQYYITAEHFLEETSTI